MSWAVEWVSALEVERLLKFAPWLQLCRLREFTLLRALFIYLFICSNLKLCVGITCFWGWEKLRCLVRDEHQENATHVLTYKTNVLNFFEIAQLAACYSTMSASHFHLITSLWHVLLLCSSKLCLTTAAQFVPLLKVLSGSFSGWTGIAGRRGTGSDQIISMPWINRICGFKQNVETFCSQISSVMWVPMRFLITRGLLLHYKTIQNVSKDFEPVPDRCSETVI